MIRMSDSVRAVVAGLSILFIGVAAGAGLDRAVLISSAAHASGAGTEDRMPRDHDEVLADLTAELGLTAEQSARLRAITSEHQATSIGPGPMYTARSTARSTA